MFYVLLNRIYKHNLIFSILFVIDEKTTQNDKIGFNQTLQSSSSLNMFNDTSHFQETQTSKNDK